jgi:hypothetical protein
MASKHERSVQRIEVIAVAIAVVVVLVVLAFRHFAGS